MTDPGSVSARTAVVLAVLALYLAAMAAWIYLVVDVNQDRNAALFYVAAFVHVGMGYVLRSRWTLLLAFVPLLLAVPAGYPSSDYGEPVPLWFSFLLLTPVAAACLMIGVLGGRFAGSIWACEPRRAMRTTRERHVE